MNCDDYSNTYVQICLKSLSGFQLSIQLKFKSLNIGFNAFAFISSFLKKVCLLQKELFTLKYFKSKVSERYENLFFFFFCIIFGRKVKMREFG